MVFLVVFVAAVLLAGLFFLAVQHVRLEQRVAALEQRCGELEAEVTDAAQRIAHDRTPAPAFPVDAVHDAVCTCAATRGDRCDLHEDDVP